MKTFLVILLLLFLNCLIGCIANYIVLKRITIATILISLVEGVYLALMLIFYTLPIMLGKLFDKLDKVIIVKKEQQ